MRKSIYRSASGRAVVQRWCIAELDRWDVPMRRSTLVVDDVDTHVLQAGSGPETVVFLPGTNFPAAMCRPLLQTLAGRSSVIAPDVPGQPGLSDEHRPPARGRLDWYGRWLSGLVAQAAGSPVTVVGWSMGAAVALASSSPLIRRVVLVSPGGLIRLKTPPVVLAASVRWIVGKREADAARLLRLMHASGREPRPLLVEWMTLVAHHVRSSRDPGVARVAVLDREYRAIGGEQDRFLPPARLRIALRHALDVDLTTVPSGGHLLAEEQADVVARFAVPWAHVGDAGAE